MRPNFKKTLGILGIVAGCGPSAPQDPSAGTTGTDESTGNGPGTDTGTLPTSESTDPTTTTPPPECDDYDDCSDLYCGYCDIDGVCRESVGCCEGYGARALDPRCSYVECVTDEDCGPDAFCDEFNTCIPIGPALPPCEDLKVIALQWALGVTPTAFVLADLDADGDLDLAAAQPSVAQIEVALNDGAGNFVLAGSFPVGDPTSSLALAAGDLDDDGDNDLAVVRGDDGGGLILLFGQDAVFVPSPALPTMPAPAAVHIREVTADALEDIVIIGPDTVTTHLGDMDASFATIVDAIPDPVDPRGVLFDFSVDGRLDVVATLPGTTAVGIWLGDGNGKFIPSSSLDTMVTHDAVLAADLDLTDQQPNDDLPHLVFAQTVPDGGELEVWPAIDAPQMFGEPQKFLTLSQISGGTFAELGAPEGPDLLAATGNPGVLVVLGDGEGGFVCERVIPVDTPTTQSLLAAGDLDNNGLADFVVGDPNSPTITVLLTP